MNDIGHKTHYADDETLAKIEQLQGAVLALREALDASQRFFINDVTACNGLKCRELNCESCKGEDEARDAVQQSYEAQKGLKDVLTSTDELAQQIRDEIERKAKVEFIHHILLDADENGVPSFILRRMADELEGGKKV